jgi:predicted permease
LLRTFENLWRIDPGFHSHYVLTFELSASKEKYPSSVEKLAFYHQVVERIKAIPGITAAGSVNHLPLDMNDGSIIASLKFDDRNSGPGKDVGAYWVVSPDYFAVIGVRLVNGRIFTERDNSQSPPVAIINQHLAHRVFADDDPVGKHLSYGSGKTAHTCEIVGVVGDIRHWGLDKEAGPEVYLSSLQVATPFISVAISTRSDAAGVASEIRGEVDKIDKDQPIYNLRSMDQIVAESLSERRFVMILLALFSILALFLSVVGIYGTMAYSTSQRTQEIGVRVALGAQARDILGLILRQGMTLVLFGVGAGILASLELTRLLAGFLFGVRPIDALTIFVVSFILIAVAVLACLLPARRATKVDPAVALRYE